VNLKLTLGYLSFQKKVKTFQRDSFPIVRITTNALYEEVIADHKTEEYKLHCKSTGGVPSKIGPFAGVETMLCILCKSFQR